MRSSNNNTRLLDRRSGLAKHESVSGLYGCVSSKPGNLSGNDCI